MSGRLITISTAATAIGIAGVAAVVSYRHAYDVVLDHGEPKGTAVLVPLCVDGLVYAAGMVHLDSARRGQKAGWLAWLALGLGIGATIAVNILHGIEAGPVGAVVAAWPAVTLVLVVELLMGMIRRSRRVADDIATTDATQDDADRDTRPAAEGDATRDAVGDTTADDADPRHVAVGDMAAVTEGDADRDTTGDAPRAIEAPKATRRRTARKTSRDAEGDADRMARARAVLADAPDISGAELGRRLGLSPRQGQRLLRDIAADPIPGQVAIPAGDTTQNAPREDDGADRDTTDTTTDETADSGAARLLSVVGGDR